MSSAAQAYQQTNFNTVGQGELLLMLYDGAIKFLRQAKEKILVKDYAQKGILISKTIDIINELAGSLNMEKGGSIAVNLNNLYFFCTTHLLQANLKMDPEKVDNVIKILSELRGAYAEIIEKPEAMRAAQQISARMAPSVNASNRQTFSSQNAAVGLSGQKLGRSVYGQQAQKSNYVQAQAVAENVNALPIAKLESLAPAVNSSADAVSNMGISSQQGQTNNVVAFENTDVQLKATLKYEQNNAQKQTIEAAKAQVFNSALKPDSDSESKSTISGLSQRPLSSLSSKASKRMSLYGKVGQ